MRHLGKSQIMPHSATRFALLATCFIAVLHRADACKICLPMPQTTAADLLIESDVVVFAREDPDKPFSYQAVDVIKGDLDSTAIDLFVNSSTRRRLEVHETLVVVLARTRGSARASNEALSGSHRDAGMGPEHLPKTRRTPGFD